MRSHTLMLLSVFFLVACKEGGGEKASVVPSHCPVAVPESQTDINDLPDPNYVLVDSTGTAVGNCIVQQGDYAWVQDATNSNFYYAVNVNDGSLRESVGMVFDDASCTSLVGEVFDYPLHLGGDIYVFEFEGALYEYPLAGMMGFPPGTYYVKAPGGSCDLFLGDPSLIREATPSAFARTFSGPVSL